MLNKSCSSVTDAKHLGSLSTLTRDEKLEEASAMTHEDRGVTIVETVQIQNLAKAHCIH
jgi:hypothetical protein